MLAVTAGEKPEIEHEADCVWHIPEIREEDIPKLARYADKEGNPLYPVPVLMDSEELEQFYYLLMEKEA